MPVGVCQVESEGLVQVCSRHNEEKTGEGKLKRGTCQIPHEDIVERFELSDTSISSIPTLGTGSEGVHKNVTFLF